MKHAILILSAFLFLAGCTPSASNLSEGEAPKYVEEPVADIPKPEESNPQPEMPSGGVDQTDFNAVAEVVANALLSNDKSPLDKLIHPDSGLYFLDHPGAFTAVHQVENMEEIKTFYPWLDETGSADAEKIQFSPDLTGMPKFDCGPMVFTKIGQYAGKEGDCHYLSEVLNFLSAMDPKLCKPHEVTCAQSLESHSREIVITNDTGEEGILFWLTEIDGKWWFSLYDVARMDCGA